MPWALVALGWLACAPRLAAAGPIATSAYVPVLNERVVLARNPPARWANGSPALLWRADDHDESYVTIQPVHQDLLPPDLRQWREQNVNVFDAHANACLQTVSSFEILSTALPDAQRANRWTRMDDRVVAAEVARVGARYLVATLRGDCPGSLPATWARLASLPSVRVIRAQPVAAAMLTTLVAHVSSLQDHDQLLARLFREEAPAHAADLLSSPTIDARQLFGLDPARGPMELYTLFINRGSDCHGLPKTLFFIWSRDPGGALRPMSSHPEVGSHDLAISAAAYVDNTDPPILIYQTRLGNGTLHAGRNGYAIDPDTTATTADLVDHKARRTCPRP